MKQDLLKGLTDEQIAKVKACKKPDELLKLVKEEGIELTDEQLTAISGGCSLTLSVVECPYCGSTWINFISTNTYKCSACERKFSK
ncbi:MAG: Nif11-like leader peptide family natural product precursor [Bacilli bacterium]|nr:Nif11-like leader peptide family natural product precursor [Bacilli bacterium]